MTTPFTDYSDAATPQFKTFFDALRTQYQGASDGAYYSSRVGSIVTGALSVLNAGLTAMSDRTPGTIIDYVEPGVVAASSIIYGVCSAIQTSKLSQINASITIGIRDAFFKTVPIFNQIAFFKKTTASKQIGESEKIPDLEAGSVLQKEELANLNAVVEDGLRYRALSAVPFTDYTDLATPEFKAAFDALRLSYQRSSDSASYTWKITSVLTQAITILNAALNALSNKTPNTVIDYVIPGILCVSSVVYGVSIAVSSSKQIQINDDIAIGVKNNFFKTVPIVDNKTLNGDKKGEVKPFDVTVVRDLEKASDLGSETTLADIQGLIEDGLRFRALRR